MFYDNNCWLETKHSVKHVSGWQMCPKTSGIHNYLLVSLLGSSTRKVVHFLKRPNICLCCWDLMHTNIAVVCQVLELVFPYIEYSGANTRTVNWITLYCYSLLPFCYSTRLPAHLYMLLSTHACLFSVKDARGWFFCKDFLSNNFTCHVELGQKWGVMLMQIWYIIL